VLNRGAAAIDQQDAAVTVPGDGFDDSAQRIEDDRKRTARRDHLEQTLLTVEQRLRDESGNRIDGTPELILHGGLLNQVLGIPWVRHWRAKLCIE
jgi:hypothetical protein